MKKLKILPIVLVLVLALGLLCGCGSKYESSSPAAPSYSYPANTSGSTVTGGSVANGGWAAAADEAYVETAVAPMEGASFTSKSESMVSVGLPENVKIIYTADIRMESTEFDATVRAIDALVSALGGYYERNELDQYGSGYRNGYYTVRVPAAGFDAFCDGVAGICQVNSISRNAQDVSEAYYDVESRLATQRTKLERLQELLRKAEVMEDIISLESAISDTELAIEQLTGSLRKYDSLVGYSTITMYLTEVYKLSEQEQPAIGFGAKLAAAFRSGSSSFVRGLEDLMLAIARGWIGWLIFLVIVAAAVLIPVRIVRKKRKARQHTEEE